METKKLKIGIDLDDVIFDFMKSFLSTYQNEFEKKFEYKDMNSFKMAKVLGITREQLSKMVNELFQNNHSEIDLCEFTEEIIPYLFENHSPIFITSRPEIHRRVTEENLKKHFPNLDFEIIFTSGFQAENNRKSKGEVCSELGLDLMIEDSQEYASDCANKGVKCFLITRPWNKEFPSHEKIIRVNNWKEILEQIKNGKP